MILLKRFREKRVNKIIETIYKKNLLKRYLMLLSGCLIVAFSFNLFFLRYNIVCFGVSGISIVLSKFGVNPSMFIRLATQIGSRLTGVLYVLDEPSIGLHQRDNQRLINSLLEMRDLGNSLIVVEHDTDTMLAADYLVDIGPYAGDNGGEVIACGTPEEVMKNKNSLTGKYLTGELKIDIPKTRRKGNKKFLEVKGAKLNNLFSFFIIVSV